MTVALIVNYNVVLVVNCAVILLVVYDCSTISKLWYSTSGELHNTSNELWYSTSGELHNTNSELWYSTMMNCLILVVNYGEMLVMNYRILVL